jgi:hypothetical protein
VAPIELVGFPRRTRGECPNEETASPLTALPGAEAALVEGVSGRVAAFAERTAAESRSMGWQWRTARRFSQPADRAPRPSPRPPQADL